MEAESSNVTALIHVPQGRLTEAICDVVRAWGDIAERGQLRICPNPLRSDTYLVLCGQRIVARLVVRGTEVPRELEAADAQ